MDQIAQKEDQTQKGAGHHIQYKTETKENNTTFKNVHISVVTVKCVNN
jgi:hypothetical protein